MTFDFFNTSDLAFGAKLTAAFKSLENLLNEAKINVEDLLSNTAILEQYINRNYQVPAPNRPNAACRTNEILDLLRDFVYIRELSYADDNLTVNVCLYNERNHIITNAIGGTDLKEGYAFVSMANSNKSTTREIRFSDENDRRSSETELFQFRIDEQNNVPVLISNIDILNLQVGEFPQYSSLQKGEDLLNSNTNSSYTATGYECVCVSVTNAQDHGNDTGILFNGARIGWVRSGMARMRLYLILYMRKGDVVSWNESDGNKGAKFKINYILKQDGGL